MKLLHSPARRLPALAAAALLLALTGADAALADEPNTIPDQNGCKVINPAPRSEETVTWTGECVDGFTSGEGILQWFQSGIPDEKYEGQMQRGYAHGKGTHMMVDGGRYEGEWADSKQQGDGTYYAPDGSTFRGTWKNGKPHGFGVLRTPEGRTIRGEWVDGQMQGEEGQGRPDDGSRT
jgi:hypothetical protein